MRPLTIAEAASAVVGLQQEIQRSEEIALRSPAAWRAAGGAGHDLPGSRASTGGCAADGRVLGAEIRAGGVDWAHGGGATGAAFAFECGADQGDKSCSAGSSQRCRPACQSLGWQDTLGVDREKVWNPAGSPPMPTPVPPFRVSAPEAKTNDRQSESVVAESAQKNSGS